MYTVKWLEPTDGLKAAEGLLLYMYIFKDGVHFRGPIHNIFEDATPAELDRRAKIKIEELEALDAMEDPAPKPKKIIYKSAEMQMSKISARLNVEITKDS